MIWDVINSNLFFVMCLITLITCLVVYFTLDVTLAMGVMGMLIIFFGFVELIPYWIAHLTLLLVSFMFVRMVYSMVVPKDGGSDYRNYSGGGE